MIDEVQQKGYRILPSELWGLYAYDWLRWGSNELRGLKPTLQPLWPCVDSRAAFITVRCIHPVDEDRWLSVSAILGEGHQARLAEMSEDQIIRRCGMLIRLLLKKLVREVVTVRQQAQA